MPLGIEVSTAPTVVGLLGTRLLLSLDFAPTSCQAVACALRVNKSCDMPHLSLFRELSATITCPLQSVQIHKEEYAACNHDLHQVHNACSFCSSRHFCTCTSRMRVPVMCLLMSSVQQVHAFAMWLKAKALQQSGELTGLLATPPVFAKQE